MPTDNDELSPVEKQPGSLDSIDSLEGRIRDILRSQNGSDMSLNELGGLGSHNGSSSTLNELGDMSPSQYGSGLSLNLNTLADTSQSQYGSGSSLNQLDVSRSHDDLSHQLEDCVNKDLDDNDHDYVL
eukprot:gb/GEZN01027038.1/.p1 GENE.gb/GEZN01027038.1/~~gb/GEZN01027038.1/.p1  ORF type:complete len:149 (+),score=10.74 gb/GEZN01027038.1/:66-449(+)